MWRRKNTRPWHGFSRPSVLEARPGCGLCMRKPQAQCTGSMPAITAVCKGGFAGSQLLPFFAPTDTVCGKGWGGAPSASNFCSSSSSLLAPQAAKWARGSWNLGMAAPGGCGVRAAMYHLETRMYSRGLHFVNTDENCV
ncbi:unnamed protein product [Ostreobium quekettii]|uniref:Uncharacterized protein n=1 Tax=Ostreobium quekettii TaxID=121088 RepID=A0A8S1IRU5_9CHLO|nr:unnamed protein product [Ostreobium quekettii]